MTQILFMILGIFSTMDGLMINYGIINIQVSKILLSITMIILFLKKKDKIMLRITPLMCFYYFSIISCLCVYFYAYNSTINNVSLNFMIQIIVFYIPFLLILSTYVNTKYIKDYFLKGLKISIFIEALWGLAQILLFNFLNIDLNKLVFSQLLNINANHSWSMLYYSNGSFSIRPSGINWEPAYFGIFMVLGIFIEKNTLKKFFYIVMLLVSLSRTGIVALILCGIYVTFENRKKFFNIKVLSKIIIILCSIIIGINTVKPLKYKSQVFVSRFNFANQNIINDGTGRHIYYYPMSLEIMFEHSNLVQILFGYGPRISGIAFSNDRDISHKLSLDDLDGVPWSVESDIVALFLGHGIIGLLIYLFMIYKNIRICKINKDKEYKYMNLILLFGGITYGFYSLLFSNMFFIMSQFTFKDMEKIDELDKKRNLDFIHVIINDKLSNN